MGFFKKSKSHHLDYTNRISRFEQSFVGSKENEEFIHRILETNLSPCGTGFSSRGAALVLGLGFTC